MEFAVLREALASLYDETPAAVLLCEPRTARVVAANAAARTLLEYDAADLAGISFEELVTEPERARDLLRGASSGKREEADLELRARGGARIAVSCEVFPARIGERVVGVFVQARMQERGLLDGLTGLPGSAMLEDRIAQTLATARRYQHRFALIEVDVDAFSTIVERFGATAGDWVLRVVAQRVRDALRASDSVARMGADRFVVLQPLVESVEDAVDVAHKIVFAMHAPIAVDGRALDVRVSLGIAVFPLDGESREELFAAAERALVNAKRNARGLFALATSSATEPAASPPR